MAHSSMYSGDASILAHCLREAIARGGARDVMEARAFLAACCRRYEPEKHPQDARHMADAWALIEPAAAPAPAPAPFARITLSEGGAMDDDGNPIPAHGIGTAEGFFIYDPYASSCGRFVVDPLEAHGITKEEAEEIIRLNTALGIPLTAPADEV